MAITTGSEPSGHSGEELRHLFAEAVSRYGATSQPASTFVGKRIGASVRVDQFVTRNDLSGDDEAISMVVRKLSTGIPRHCAGCGRLRPRLEARVDHLRGEKAFNMDATCVTRNVEDCPRNIYAMPTTKHFSVESFEREYLTGHCSKASEEAPPLPTDTPKTKAPIVW